VATMLLHPESEHMYRVEHKPTNIIVYSERVEEAQVRCDNDVDNILLFTTRLRK